MTLKKTPAISFFVVLAAVCTTALIIFCLNYPLLGSLGSEAGLLFGVIMGPLMYLSASVRGAYRDERGFGSDLAHQLTLAFAACALFAAALFINSFFVKSCAPARGFGPFAVHAIPVLCLNVACGLWIGRIVGSRLLAFLTAIFVGCAYIGGCVLLWWQNPSFRFLSHPLLAIDGDLWQGAGLAPEIVGYKLATLLFALALMTLGAFVFSVSQRSGFSSERASTSLSALIPTLALAVIATTLHFAVMHNLEPSIASRAEVLSRELRRGQFVVHSDPHQTTLDEANSILAEAALWASRLKTRMGDVLASDVHIWLYPDTETLTRFTGAAHVHFALPAHRHFPAQWDPKLGIHVT